MSDQEDKTVEKADGSAPVTEPVSESAVKQEAPAEPRTATTKDENAAPQGSCEPQALYAATGGSRHTPRVLEDGGPGEGTSCKKFLPPEIAFSDKPEASAEPETLPPPNHLAEKRGRMVAAGAVTAVILSAIAVLVAGIFHLTGRWMVYCPRDLPVNDPAPILWKDLTADREAASSLGVPEGLASQAGLKAVVPESK
ncbi:MAG: hypothetical protein AB1646_16090 [Thermodesulfobacteriota bacterium]